MKRFLWIERNWRVRAGVRERTRGWQVILFGLVLRYGVFYDYTSSTGPDLRLSVCWRPWTPRSKPGTSALLYIIFPRAAVERR